MPVSAPIILVVGADSMVGHALWERLLGDGAEVVGTTRRHERVHDRMLHLDLAGDISRWICPYEVNVAILCAAVARIEDCRKDPSTAARVNVRGALALAQRLVTQGARVIYLSTNQVFDGTSPHRAPDDPVAPVTEYGRQKAKAERELRALGNRITIARFTKILARNTPLFQSWILALRNGEIIHPFSDMVMAPVTLELAVEVLHRLIDTPLPGIIQISGPEDITYEQAGRHIAARIGANPQSVQPISVTQTNVMSEGVPPHTTLDTTRLRTELGIDPPGPRETLDSVLVH